MFLSSRCFEWVGVGFGDLGQRSTEPRERTAIDDLNLSVGVTGKLLKLKAKAYIIITRHVKNTWGHHPF